MCVFHYLCTIIAERSGETLSLPFLLKLFKMKHIPLVIGALLFSTLFHKQGIDLKKIEKGCVIDNTKPDEGYLARVFDNQNRGADAQYWTNDFLGLKPIANEYKQTNEFLGMTKEFISKQIDNEFEVSKTDKIDLLNN